MSWYGPANMFIQLALRVTPDTMFLPLKRGLYKDVSMQLKCQCLRKAEQCNDVKVAEALDIALS